MVNKKPVLPSVPLTAEDYDIFTYGPRPVLTHEYAQLAFRLDRMSETTDRRDAEVMLQLTGFDYWERDYTEDRARRWPTAQRWVKHQL